MPPMAHTEPVKVNLPLGIAWFGLHIVVLLGLSILESVLHTWGIDSTCKATQYCYNSQYESLVSGFPCSFESCGAFRADAADRWQKKLIEAHLWVLFLSLLLTSVAPFCFCEECLSHSPLPLILWWTLPCQPYSKAQQLWNLEPK